MYTDGELFLKITEISLFKTATRPYVDTSQLKVSPKMMSLERASQEEHFSFIAPSSEEL